MARKRRRKTHSSSRVRASSSGLNVGTAMTKKWRARLANPGIKPILPYKVWPRLQGSNNPGTAVAVALPMNTVVTPQQVVQEKIVESKAETGGFFSRLLWGPQILHPVEYGEGFLHI